MLDNVKFQQHDTPSNLDILIIILLLRFVEAHNRNHCNLSVEILLEIKREIIING